MIRPLIAGPHAFEELVRYLGETGISSVALIADEQTHRVAGERLAARIQASGRRAAACLLPPNENGDVVADERTIVHCLLGVPEDARLLVAVGAGTIHDVVRFAAHKMKLPFVSVPTAASVDGFTSSGAPLIIAGRKQTVPAVAPRALFADTEVLAAAPRRLAAAGFGDMLAKYTALFDWRFGHLMADEPYDAGLAEEMAQTVADCVDHAAQIASGNEEGIAVLMNSLIRSGLIMLKFGASHPASGAEHHLSHYWEMEHLREGKRQLLHGLKTGFAAVRIAELYHGFLRRFEQTGGALAGSIRDGAVRERLVRHWPEIRASLAALPPSGRLLDLMRAAYPEITALPISPEQVRRGLREAPAVRPNRCTLLRFLGENGLLPD